jgi:multidrug efflux pump subunit AcrA (membrane-fusion protein)
VLGILTALTAGCGSIAARQAAPTPLPVVADLGGITVEGRLEPIRFVTLSAGVDGLVSEVLVAEGEQVRAGQLMVRLDNVNAQTLEAAQNAAAVELGAAHEAVRVAQNELDDYPLPRVFVGLTAEEAARTWLAELDAAKEAFEPFEDTSRKGLRKSSAFPSVVYPSLPERVLFDTHEYDEMAMVYKKRVDVGWMNYTKAVLWANLYAPLVSAKARLADAQRRYDAVSAALSASESSGARAALATADIRAPFDGTVTALELKPGELATTGNPIVTVADLSGWIVKTVDLTEIDVVDVEVGMPVTVVLDALPDTEFGGSVLSIDLSYSDRQGDIVYPVRILLADKDPGMRWGMTAQVSFEE